MKDSQSPWEGPRQSRGTVTVTDPALADLLTDPKVLKQLEPFLGHDCTVAEAARQTGSLPNTVLARVRRWLRLGLLETVRTEKRQGRAVRHYRTVADSWFIPFDNTSAATLKESLAVRDAYWEDRLRSAVVSVREELAGSWGTRIYRDGRGRLQIQMAVSPDSNWTSLAPDRPAVLAAWRDGLYLDFEDAKRLQQELFSLLLRYQQLDGAQRYLLRLGLAPLGDWGREG